MSRTKQKILTSLPEPWQLSHSGIYIYMSTYTNILLLY